MSETKSASTDNALLAFAVRTPPTKYGDGKVFYDYRILIRSKGMVVGYEEGPRRTHTDRASSRRAGLARVQELRSHRLYIIRVTDKHIQDGEERSCSSCAIAQALWSNQERMGLSEWEWDFRVEPYGFAADVKGIVLEKQHDSYAPRLVSGVDGMPDLVMPTRHRREGWAVESMLEWAMHWDDWAESRHMTFKEWKEEHSDDDCKPYKPSPCAFVLDLDALKPETEEPSFAPARASAANAEGEMK